MSDLHFSENTEQRLPYWEPSKEASDIQGTVVEDRSITTKYGQMDGSVIEIAEAVDCRDGSQGDVYSAEPGAQIVVWRKNATLKNAWEAPENGDGQSDYYHIRPGDMVRGRYDGTRVSQKYNKSYPIFRVRVLPQEEEEEA